MQEGGDGGGHPHIDAGGIVVSNTAMLSHGNNEFDQ